MTKYLVRFPNQRRPAKAKDSSVAVYTLRTESTGELAELIAAFVEELEPQNALERALLSEVARFTWNIMRYHRIANGILNKALQLALACTLDDILLPGAKGTTAREAWKVSKDLACQWLLDGCLKNNAETQVRSLLEEAGYDYSVVEARAFSNAAPMLGPVHRLLDWNMTARDRSLKTFKAARKAFVVQLRKQSDARIAADDGQNVSAED